jgi:Uma2 family endonuclease
MAVANASRRETEWTVRDLNQRFGPMPFWRFRAEPAPGTATEQDVVTIRDTERLLYELVDGVLVRKTIGTYESYLAGCVLNLLSAFIRPRKLGIALPPDGMLRLSPGLVRIPDVSFIGRDRLPNRRLPRVPVWPIVPDLLVEVLSESNTKKEMDEKLRDYFGSGVKLVSYVDPEKRHVRVFTAIDRSQVVRESQTLTGGDVLPGFQLALRELFAEPL